MCGDVKLSKCLKLSKPDPVGAYWGLVRVQHMNRYSKALIAALGYIDSIQSLMTFKIKSEQ